MPQFYFNLVSGGERMTDDLGLELPSVEVAYLEAYRGALDVIHDMLRDRQDPTGYRFEVTDDRGRVLLELPFSEAMQPRGRPSLRDVDGVLQRGLERSRQLREEIDAEMVKMRAGLERSREVLKRSRVQPAL
jgi:hypothetical protein